VGKSVNVGGGGGGVGGVIEEGGRDYLKGKDGYRKKASTILSAR